MCIKNLDKGAFVFYPDKYLLDIFWAPCACGENQPVYQQRIPGTAINLIAGHL